MGPFFPGSEYLELEAQGLAVECVVVKGPFVPPVPSGITTCTGVEVGVVWQVHAPMRLLSPVIRRTQAPSDSTIPAGRSQCEEIERHPVQLPEKERT